MKLFRTSSKASSLTIQAELASVIIFQFYTKEMYLSQQYIYQYAYRIELHDLTYVILDVNNQAISNQEVATLGRFFTETLKRLYSFLSPTPKNQRMY